ncbi:MAG: hypothetical protein WCI92_17970 [Bacteroidota bacterium]
MKIIFTILALMFVYCAAISGNFTRLIFPSSQPPINNVEVSSTGGPVIPSYYTTLKEAFNAITPGTQQGDIIVKINASITETASAVFISNRVCAG